MNEDISFSVSEFVAILNQMLEFAYPSVTVTGEIANFRVSKNRWVYFDLKDEAATVRFFGTVYQLPGPLEDGMMLAVRGVPKLHAQYGFSVNIMSMRPVGQGSIKKAAALLQAKLEAEGLFDPLRKRALPYPPTRVGLVTSGESAAYRDFVKVLAARWGGIEITLVDVQVQGEIAPAQIAAAIECCNQLAEPPDVLVITRGGGSAEDLQAFSTEQVTRAVAASRIPTLVAIGHEVDISLAELAADQRASTPSNAAELLVPDRKAILAQIPSYKRQLAQCALQAVKDARQTVALARRALHDRAELSALHAWRQLAAHRQLLAAYDPQAALQRGYALVQANGVLIRSGKQIAAGNELDITLQDARVTAEVKRVTMGKG
ncbi:MAG TPA: exodeoxyribonuclease VII large subunit [Candidatus Saccharimonadales bacterium]|jgi:exodeoxyribonuclease VII large subunit|nr:exodeoxyribonuclease VII large subunit [Candidatus Saccharimonadales bacterium]